MKTLLASAAVLTLLATGAAMAGSKMSSDHHSNSPRMQMSDSDDRMDHAMDRRGHEKYDDDDRSEYMRGHYADDDDDDDREYSNRGPRGFERMDANGDGVIDRDEFIAHMQDHDRS